MISLSIASRKNYAASFTLIELLIVMAIIALLVGLTLYAASGVMLKAGRSRAAGEILAMSNAMDGYKTDNGTYPITDVATGYSMTSSTLLTNSTAAPYFSTTLDGTSTTYKQTSQVLYLDLSGQTNFTDTPAAGVKVYMSFTRNQVGDTAGGSYAQDPWRNSYGYSTGTAAGGGPTTNYPFSGTGFFDLWSTGGLSATKVAANPSLTNAWISNWRP